MTDQWYIARDGQTFGPYTPEQVQELSRIQPLLPTDQMLRAGTQVWRPALLIAELFAAPEVPPATIAVAEFEPVPMAVPVAEFAPEPSSSPTIAMDESPPPSFARPRRNTRSEGKTPIWFWLGPIGGAALMGILTVVLVFSGRTPPPQPPREERRPTVRRLPTQPPSRRRAEGPPPPTDYSVSKVDYTKGLDGAKIVLLEDTPARRSQGFVDARGKKVRHGKIEEFYPDSTDKKSEEWYAAGEKHGPATTWDEAGKKTTEGQNFHGAKQGKWTTFRKDGTVAREEMWYRGTKLGPTTTFHANGKKAQTAEYKNDRRTGPAKAWDEAGKELSPDESLRTDLASVNYEDMIDILGTPTDVKESSTGGGSLHIWATPEDRYIAVWVTQDRRGVSTKRDIRAFGATREAIDKLKRELR